MLGEEALSGLYDGETGETCLLISPGWSSTVDSAPFSR